MLDAETKRRIDTARDILVGKVPDPKSQVEQITIALIYKFMDDMDALSEELGGERSFFTGEFRQYGWARLMQPGLGGHETRALYALAIERMDQNEGIPQLFRDIFSNAYLPYRDPETLRAFLKVIDGFTYDHSERLGDAFEYLLSVMDSQGDAGQFRTPRHIIDFIVSIVDPKKEDVVLDPACGTAGFLISSYKHILAANTDTDGNSTLTPDDRERLARNLTGYDISPDMVRLSLVNMYLHGLVAPRIHEYDTLTSEERWNEYADVILANPPFMSPKGGIRPHNRFGVNSRRSEVLFVDYMVEHLNAGGRAGIIVPEGIIFQSQNAHKQLRKKLVEESLVAVVSLPAGVFNPYSGVKTSILLLDKALARTTDRIAFFKVENDGFDLGAQRRQIDENDLPKVRGEIVAYLQGLRGSGQGSDMRSTPVALAAESRAEYRADGSQPTNGLIVEKEKVAADEEYSLSGERYRDVETYKHHKWPMAELRDICKEILSGGTPSTKNREYWKGEIPWITSADIVDIKTAIPRKYITEHAIKESATNLIRKGNVIVVTRVGLGKLFRNDFDVCISQDSQGLIVKDEVSPEYLAYILKDRVENFKKVSQGSTIQGVTKKQLSDIRIPLPPLDVQEEIVAEIEGYQKVIDGARAVVENYRPHIHVDPEWPTHFLGDLSENLDSKRVPIAKANRIKGPFPYYGASGIVDYVDDFIFDEEVLLVSEDGANLLARTTPIAFSVSGKCWVNNHAHVLKLQSNELLKWIEIYLNSISLEHFVTGSAQPKLNQRMLGSIPIPIPSDPASLKAMISEIEDEKTLVDANRELIKRFERKIRAVVGRVWGKEKSEADS